MYGKAVGAEHEALAMRAFMFGLACRADIPDNVRKTALGYFLNQAQRRKEDFVFYVKISRLLDRFYPSWKTPILESEWKILGRTIFYAQSGLNPDPDIVHSFPGSREFFKLRPDLLALAQRKKSELLVEAPQEQSVPTSSDREREPEDQQERKSEAL